MPEERFEFQTEAAELLKMMINSVYSNRDIFLRELVSNASDALDKRRIEKVKNAELADFKPEIRIIRDKDNRGELGRYLGTIAKSGTKEFLAAVKSENNNNQENLIGQFGVGFYSAFMVADSVEVLSRKLGESGACLFKSDGSGAYTLDDAVTRDECGTTVTLHLKPVNQDNNITKDYTDEWVIRDLISKYSDYIAWPIVMPVTRHKDDQEVVQDETLNSQKAIWVRPEKDVKEEEYNEFYRHLTHDWKEPLAHIRLNAEGATSFKGLLFIPAEAPFDLVMDPNSGGISLYINRVFIMNDCKELIPEYMRFIRGVIDSDDLSLNISREILQDEPVIRVIKRSAQRKIFNELKKLLESDREKYEKFWNSFRQIFKWGVIQDSEHAKNILELALFNTSDHDGWTSIAEYRSRMKPEQAGIYCLAGRDLAALKSSPKLEAFKAKGYEVLLMSDAVDEVILVNAEDALGDEHLKLLNISLDSVSIQSEDEKKAAEDELKDIEAKFAPVKEQAMAAMGDKLEDVRPSLSMTDSPACLRDTFNGLFQMEQVLRAMGQNPQPQKRILELNIKHPLVKKLMDMAESNDGQFTNLLEILYDQSLILEGAVLSEPASFVKRLNEVMTKAFGA